MSYRVDPSLAKKLAKYGRQSDWNDCFHCGNCTATCSLTEQGLMFPRKSIRAMQMGLKDSLEASTEPWLCYYCGECSEKCPREANPGELMMTLRRYLTSVYDWTGLSGKLYQSFASHMLLMIVLFFGVIAAFFMFAKVPVLTDPTNVQLNTFAPVSVISLYDHITLILLSFFLLSNVFNMYKKVILNDKKVHIPAWL